MNCKYTVILDIDQTLIDSEEYHPSEHDNLFNSFDDKFIYQYDKHSKRRIAFSRPGLQLFLDFLFQHFNVCIWTAATTHHALPLINHFIYEANPSRKNQIKFIICRDQLKKLNTKDQAEQYWLDEMKKQHTKNVRWLINNIVFDDIILNECSTILIDDSDRHLKQYADNDKNMIHISPFKASSSHSKYDNELFFIIKTLQELLNQHSDNIQLCKLNHQTNPCDINFQDKVYLPKYQNTIYNIYPEMKDKMIKQQVDANIVVHDLLSIQNQQLKKILMSDSIQTLWKQDLSKLRQKQIEKHLISKTLKACHSQNITCCKIWLKFTVGQLIKNSKSSKPFKPLSGYFMYEYIPVEAFNSFIESLLSATNYKS